MHRISALEAKIGDVAAAARAELHLAERLLAKGWRIAALYRLRKLAELHGRLPPKVRERFDNPAARIEALRAEIAPGRVTVSDYDEAARALERNGRDADVVELLGKMIALEPDNPVFHARLAEAHCRLGRVDDAIPWFRTAAHALVEFDRRSDAIRVYERLLHLRSTPDDALEAAALYLERGDRNDAVRAVSKLGVCVDADAEDLDVLGLLARAFDAMGQPSRALQVRVEMARIAHEAGETELFRDLVGSLTLVAPEDPSVRALVAPAAPVHGSAPSLSFRNSVVSVTNEDLASMEEAPDEKAETSVLEDLSFEELSEIWVMPVISKAAQRALNEADAFARLRLYRKAEYVLRGAIDEDPVCSELREALRNALQALGDTEAFVDETLALADLYRQRRFVGRARTLVAEALAIAPEDARARALDAELASRDRERGRENTAAH